MVPPLALSAVKMFTVVAALSLLTVADFSKCKKGKVCTLPLTVSDFSQ